MCSYLSDFIFLIKVWPWDDYGHIVGSDRPDWDAPICDKDSNPSDQCISCDWYWSTEYEDKSMPTSCFPWWRAYARPLRSYFMNAAEKLLEGPLQLCRLQARLDRWYEEIKDLVQDKDFKKHFFVIFSSNFH